jgi:EAL domain-containing protein (putative c-di-GMP-specific phosphodiesterase class I)
VPCGPWEVLARWQHPTLGNIPPGVFIPIAEKCGLIGALGDLIIEHALKYLVAALTELRDAGVLVAVDDFGIGYSSLSLLRRLPADVVKLDCSFLTETGHSDRLGCRVPRRRRSARAYCRAPGDYQRR